MEEIKSFLTSNPIIEQSAYAFLVILLSVVTYFISKKIIITNIHRITDKTKTEIDNILLSPKLMRYVSLVVPMLAVNYFSYFFPDYQAVILRITESLIALFVLLAFGSLLNSITTLSERSEKLKDKPIKGYVQIVKIILYLFGAIIIIGLLANQSPFTLLSAVAGLTAVIILIFRDTILSFVASIQISSYDLIKVGDWIEVPHFGADGDVVDIALHTVKVQNFDKTITVIPTYKLIEVSFKNWRGMQQSGGRRIKRSLFIDKATIKFCSDEMIEKYKKIELITDYLIKKESEVNKHNQSKPGTTFETNKRRLTNIGTFREYVKAYLRSREDINKNMPFLIRQLQPTSEGLPLEIYIFTTTTEWFKYEDIQSNIFDHLMAVIPEFELRLYQKPSGNDFNKIIQG